MTFSLEQRLTITKAIRAHWSFRKGLATNRWRRNYRFEDNAVIFYENERYNLPSHYNCHLHVIVKVREIKLKRAILDHGLSLNIIFLSALDAVVCREIVFGGNWSRHRYFEAIDAHPWVHECWLDNRFDESCGQVPCYWFSNRLTPIAWTTLDLSP